MCKLQTVVVVMFSPLDKVMACFLFCPLYPGNPGLVTCWIQDWVGYMAVVNVEVKKQSFCHLTQNQSVSYFHFPRFKSSLLS